MNQGIVLALLTALTIAVTGCTMHRVDIQQGNVLEAETVAELEPGMTERQVRFLLGTPLVVDPFRDDRWDYVYVFKPGRGGETEHRKLSLYFEEGRLTRIVGADEIPDEPPAGGEPPEDLEITPGGPPAEPSPGAPPPEGGQQPRPY